MSNNRWSAHWEVHTVETRTFTEPCIYLFPFLHKVLHNSVEIVSVLQGGTD
jgi:hypothetical protein